jgi:hypothetical protein
MNARIRRIPAPRALLACAAVLLAACGGARPAAPGPAPLGPVVQAAVIYDDDAGGMRDSVRLVVRDPAAFEVLWRRATDGQASPPPLPAIDFTREMVVAVGAGRMTPNDRIRVDSVGGLRQGPGGRDAMVVLVRTTEGCERFPAAAWPLQLVRVRRHDGPVVFVERRVRAEACSRA